ncbi:hypothetical protein C8R44DRAFT_883581 [Mycena epipterygia]|nr:hypothetical protein C8R44DRAFT_883581 [Mycena epipterygia]
MEPVVHSHLCQAIISRWASSLQHLESTGFVDSLPLTKLRHLEVLGIRNSPTLSILGFDVPAIAAAWPKITSLIIPSVPGASISSLRVLADNCSDLTGFEMVIATLHVPPVCRHLIRNLNLHHSVCPPASVQSLARHVDRLFPRLFSLRAGLPDEYHWKEVESWIFAFQDVRLQT